jgi:hypothetical protein
LVTHALPREMGIGVSGRGERARADGTDIIGTVRVARSQDGDADQKVA